MKASPYSFVAGIFCMPPNYNARGDFLNVI